MKLSPKAAGTYLECPKQYRYLYVDRPRLPQRGGPWAHLTLGNVLHEVLGEWTMLDPADRTPERALRLLAARWRDDGFRDGAQAGLWFTIACDWLEAYCARPEVQATVVRGSERTVSALYTSEKTGRTLNVEGRVDRIDQRGNRLVVVDYKTSKHPPDEAEAAGSYALAVYALGATRILGRAYGWCTRAELHHLPTNTVVAVDYDRERIHRVLDRLVDLAREIESARAAHIELARGAGSVMFPARPGPLCATCPFLDYCTEGQARAARADGWAYLGEATVSQR